MEPRGSVDEVHNLRPSSLENHSVKEALALNAYLLIKSFISIAECDCLAETVIRYAREHYKAENIESHAAYISDDNRGRNSFAFALQHPRHQSPLPCLDLWHYSPMEKSSGNNSTDEKYAVGLDVLRQTTSRVFDLIGLEKGRSLFNVQRYWSKSLPVLTHRDGEVFEADNSVANNRHNVIRALHPRKVALLTLQNNAVHGGTRLTFKDGSSTVIEAQPGDLLIFDNVNTEHGVDELLPRNAMEAHGEVIRQIVGWRAMEFDCSYLNRRLLYEFDIFNNRSKP